MKRLIRFLHSYFKDDVKIALWLETPNPALGRVRPLDMVAAGRIDKLLKFVESALEENKK